MPRIFLAFPAIMLGLGSASPLAAQDPGAEAAVPERTRRPASVFDGDWVTIGIGAAVSPSYAGSDDYVISPLPFLQGRLGRVGINPRPAGMALDFIDDPRGAKVELALGVAARVNRNRVNRIEDPVVAAYGELETAIEVGPAVGLSVNRVLNRYDSLSLGVDALWDVNGAHKGRSIVPSITYFTPVSRGTAVSVSLSARHVDDGYAAYYYSVPAIAVIGGGLPAFNASGGFDRIGANLLTAVDFDGDVTNGGLAGFLIGGWSKMQGDAARTPFTAIRGSAEQWFFGAGLGYTF